MIAIVLCVTCATSRGAFGANAERYARKAIGIWRGVCEDCGVRGSSGDEATNLARYHITEKNEPPPPSTRPTLPLDGEDGCE